MSRKKRSRYLISALLLAGCMGLLAGCAEKDAEVPEPPVEEVQAEAEAEPEPEEDKGGILVLKVNPEIAVEYDKDGKVTALQGRNEEGRKIAESCQDYMGRECHEVVEELVRAIHEAGYFVEEVEGVGKKITIEIETGSIVPQESFLDEIVTGVQAYVKNMQMDNPVVTDAGSQGAVREIDIYDHEYGAKSYEAVSSSGNKTGTGAADTSAPADSGTAGSAQSSSGADSSQAPSASDTAGSTARPTGAHESPYTDYETPYTGQQSPYTDYETPYTETRHESPYTDYETPYMESQQTSPYTDYRDPETPYEADRHGDSGYSHYEEHSDYSDYD